MCILHSPLGRSYFINRVPENVMVTIQNCVNVEYDGTCKGQVMIVAHLVNVGCVSRSSVQNNLIHTYNCSKLHVLKAT